MNATIIVVNGKELEFNAFDADTMERYELALESVTEVVENLQANTELRASESIKKQCESVFDFFDDVFGDGISDDVFGGKYDLTACLDAFETVILSVDKQKDEFQAKYSKYIGNNVAPNRTQRRAQSRAVNK